jgi:hypothetical protein
MSFPTPQQIGQIFQLRQSDPPAFVEYLGPDITLATTGHDDAFSGEIKGKENVKTKHVAPILGLLDSEKASFQQDIIRVIGGGDSNFHGAAVELKTTSTSKRGTCLKVIVYLD